MENVEKEAARAFSVTEDKTEGKKTHKQAAIQGSYSEGLSKPLKEENTAGGNVHGN